MQNWDIYEITTADSLIKGVMLRGRIRKFAIHKHIELLAENATDLENCVRFGIHSGEDTGVISKFILSLVPDGNVRLVLTEIENPVLSKLKVNIMDRYTI